MATAKGLTSKPPTDKRWVRVGVGKWKDNTTGKVYNSQNDPTKTNNTPMWNGKVSKGFLSAPPSTTQSSTANPEAVATDPFKLTTPIEIADAQKQANIATAQEQARLNRINEQTAYGSSQYQTNPDGSITRVVSLSPAEQAKLDWQNQMEGRANQFAEQQFAGVQSALGQPLSFSDLGAIPTAETFAADRKRIEDSIFNRYMERLKPQMDEQYQNFQREMIDRGIPEGSELYNRQLGEFRQSQADAIKDITTQAVQTGGTEQSRLFEESLRGRQQSINERLQQRAAPLSEMQQILQLRGGVQNPQFSQTPEISVAPTDVTGAFSNYQNALLQQQSLGQQQQQFLADQQFKAQQAEMDRQLQREAIRKAGGGGGGGGGPDYFQKLDYETKAQMALNEQKFNQEKELLGLQNPSKKNKKGSGLASAGAAAVGSFAGGLGQTAGSSIGSGLFGRGK